MDEFEQMCKDAGVDDLDRPWVETFYNAGFRSGLRRAAEIANEPYSNEVQASGSDEPSEVGLKISEAIEREAQKEGT